MGTGGRAAVADVRPAPRPQLPATKLGIGDPAWRECGFRRGPRVSAAQQRVGVTGSLPPTFPSVPGAIPATARGDAGAALSGPPWRGRAGPASG